MIVPEEPDFSNSEPNSVAFQPQELTDRAVKQTGKYGVALGQGSGGYSYWRSHLPNRPRNPTPYRQRRTLVHRISQRYTNH